MLKPTGATEPERLGGEGRGPASLSNRVSRDHTQKVKTVSNEQPFYGMDRLWSFIVSNDTQGEGESPKRPRECNNKKISFRVDL